MESQEHRSLSGIALVVIAVASGCLTWLCVRWFGAQNPLTAAIAVILVELFIACFAMIGLLITERISSAYLTYEETHPEKPSTSYRMWLWRPLWEPRVRYVTSRSYSPGRTADWQQDESRNTLPTDTISFPHRVNTPHDHRPPQRRAA
ncbi:MAG: hypothetical protein KDA86_16935 [Planctomycetaceae bacterium]|nr:hypothetical protein [Planctomycetaceae bacterium]MCA9109758.1 hypothetical protein [Planctomycetaceae bacterium]